MKTRVAGPADVDTVARLHVASWQAAYRGIMPDHVIARTDVAYRTRFWSSRLGDPDWPVFLLEDDEGLGLGFVHVVADPDEDGNPATTGHITSLHVLPHLRGKGLGRTLLAHALSHIAGTGRRQATLWVLERNVAARGFYEALGWKDDGGRKDYPGTEVPEVRYRLQITGH